MTHSLPLRQCQVVDLVRRGLVNKDIAAQLRLTEGTVKTMLCEIYKRVNMRRYQLMLTSDVFTVTEKPVKVVTVQDEILAA